MTIKLSAISKRWGSVEVLKDVDISVERGETVVLLGPSGAGKSSLLRLLNLLDTPDSGTMSIAGESFDFSSVNNAKQLEQRANLLRTRVGTVFQQYHLWPHFTVMENLTYAPQKVLGWDKTRSQEKAVQLLTRLQLANKASAYPSQLSGGQQQRVAIARALMMEPEILLFDEPTAALDPEITNQVAAIIKDLAQTGITQVIVTHEVSFARNVATQVVYLEQGKVVEQGGADRFVAPQSAQFANYLTH